MLGHVRYRHGERHAVDVEQGAPSMTRHMVHFLLLVIFGHGCGRDGGRRLGAEYGVRQWIGLVKVSSRSGLFRRRREPDATVNCPSSTRTTPRAILRKR